jgi:hypothetical protein
MFVEPLANIRMETDVPKSHALCKTKSTMRAFPARGSCGRWLQNAAASKPRRFRPASRKRRLIRIAARGGNVATGPFVACCADSRKSRCRKEKRGDVARVSMASAARLFCLLPGTNDDSYRRGNSHNLKNKRCHLISSSGEHPQKLINRRADDAAGECAKCRRHDLPVP